MLSSLTCLVHYLSRALHAVMPNVPRALRTFHPACYPASPDLFPTFSLVLHDSSLVCSCASCASCPVCCRVPPCLLPNVPCILCTLVLYGIVLPYLPLVFRNISTLSANVTFCTLEFLCITLLFFRWFPACDFFGRNLLKLDQT